jgi:hypothetical protein
MEAFCATKLPFTLLHECATLFLMLTLGEVLDEVPRVVVNVIIFRRNRLLHHDDRKTSYIEDLRLPFALKMGVGGFLETLAPLYQTVRRRAM